MTFDGIDTETDIEKLRHKARELAIRLRSIEGEVEVLMARISQLTYALAVAQDRDRQLALNLELKRLNEQLAAKNKELFGSSRSERRPVKAEATQTQLAAGKDDAKEGEEKAEEQKKPKKRGHGPNPQERLDFRVEEHKLDEPDMICPNCEAVLVMPEMSGQTEDTEQIEIVERVLRRVVHKKQKYRCTCCGHVETALGPKPLVPGGRYTPELAVTVAVEKYEDHLPLERQVDRFDRLGFEVTSQTLWDLLVALYYLLLPSYVAIQQHLLQQDVLGADETPWRVMGKGASAKWYVWALCGKDAVFYKLAPTRGKAGAQELLQDFDGFLMADGYAVYKALEKEGKEGTQVSLLELLAGTEASDAAIPRYTLLGCWMHARRDFFKAEKNHPAAAGALDLIAQLYRIEARAEEEAAGDPARLLEIRRRLRDTESRAVVGKLKAWADQQKPAPGLKFDDALGYLLNQWPWLIRFLEDPRIPLDNGATERAMRGPVLGRKNHYGSRSELGTRVAALFYTLCETCSMVGVNQTAYLLAAARLAMENGKSVLLPHTFAAELAAAEKASAAEPSTETADGAPA